MSKRRLRSFTITFGLLLTLIHELLVLVAAVDDELPFVHHLAVLGLHFVEFVCPILWLLIAMSSIRSLTIGVGQKSLRCLHLAVFQMLVQFRMTHYRLSVDMRVEIFILCLGLIRLHRLGLRPFLPTKLTDEVFASLNGRFFRLWRGRVGIGVKGLEDPR